MACYHVWMHPLHTCATSHACMHAIPTAGCKKLLNVANPFCCRVHPVLFSVMSCKHAPGSLTMSSLKSAVSEPSVFEILFLHHIALHGM